MLLALVGGAVAFVLVATGSLVAGAVAGLLVLGAALFAIRASVPEDPGRRRFLGVMGSRRHVAPYLDDLRAMGFDDVALARIRSPVGLDLGGRRPQDIALSIAAGLVAARNGRAAGWLDAEP